MPHLLHGTGMQRWFDDGMDDLGIILLIMLAFGLGVIAIYIWWW